MRRAGTSRLESALRGLRKGRVERAGRSWVCQVVGMHADPQYVFAALPAAVQRLLRAFACTRLLWACWLANVCRVTLIGQACMLGIGQRSPGVGPAKHAEKT